MFVKPNDGRSVPDPDRGDLLPAEGREVSQSQYWFRRQLDGDVSIALSPEQAVTEEPETQPKVVSKKGAK
ncbi:MULTISPECIES: DUF2635 domain-containing protein [Aeromonas]|uniref:DUF2635 domain-containing protein n=1 Tax=Aeromonas TaxID=642 RepID=UPI00123A5EB7|nr:MULTISPECIES: DUF2635 domain-containing protein [Aeromonas]QET79810.1 DUF2635 domain-containing protein [Aeromonas veronii]UJQ36128.1 DUF2635 domain-containing protein [Aeromonas caviae]